MKPQTIFKCTTYSCSMEVQHCVQRQKHHEMYSNGHGRAAFPRVLPHLRHCSSGKCVQGQRIALKLAGQPIRPVTKLTGEYLANQRKLLRKWEQKAAVNE